MIDDVEPSAQKGAEEKAVSQGRLLEVLMVLLESEKLLEINSVFLF